ncbi:MAG: beta-N-acetylhexosaminidase [Ostreibacterium sp.]
MDQSKDKLSFKLFCNAKHSNNKSSLNFKLIANRTLTHSAYLCFTCLADFSNAKFSDAQYERVGSFFKIALVKDRHEWCFSFDGSAYEFRNITDAPQNAFVDLGSKIASDLALMFSSDYRQLDEEAIPTDKQTVEHYLPIFPQVNKVITYSASTHIVHGFAIESINATKANKVLSETINLFSGMLNPKGFKVVCILNNAIAGYKLTLDNQQITIVSQTLCDEFYALITLGQLWHFSNKQLQHVVIEDKAKHQWRGLAIDTVRRFYSIDELKQLINYLALFKFNRLQLHLSDDEGWRIESTCYPQLNEFASYRGYYLRIKPQFGTSYEKSGGFYTKVQMADLIAYASNYYIEIMPEFDFPAHCHAVLKSLPQLIEATDTSQYTSVQGYQQNTLNPGLAFTWEFLEKIIKEYSELFTFDYMHMGFDERPVGSWEHSPACKALMLKHNINNTTDLQTYSANRLLFILQQYGKKTAFWEEATKGKINNKESLIFSWSNEEMTEKIAHQGYQVIASPAQFFYFDIREKKDFHSPGLHWVDSLRLEKVYCSQIINHENIVGIQGALWGEALTTKETVYNRLFPRIVALSEVAWTEDNRKDVTQFVNNVERLMTGNLLF